MTTKLTEFIAEVKGGVAKTNFFAVNLTLPELLHSIEPIKSKMNRVMLFCDQAQLPGLSFSTSQVRSYGEYKEVPYEKLFESVTLSFYVDADMTVKKLFDEWVGLIQDPTTRQFNYPKYYLTDKIDIIVTDAQDQQRYMVTLHRAYPKAISPVQLDYATKDVMKLQVTLSYQYATMTQLAGGIKENSTDLMNNITSQMPNFDYGFGSLTTIPTSYFNDFNKFQQAYQNVDFSFDGAKTVLSADNIGEFTGFGGIFI